MTLVQSYGCPYRKHPSVALSDSFLFPELGDNLSNQSAKPLEINLLIVVVFAIALFIFKYTKEDLQQIFKTVLKV